MHSDSQLIVNQMKGLYKVKHPDLRPLHERAKKQAAGLEAFTIQYVPREQNREADAAANAALDNTGGVKPAFASEPAKPRTRAHANLAHRFRAAQNSRALPRRCSGSRRAAGLRRK